MVSGGEETVMDSTVMVSGKFSAVSRVSCTAFQPAFVISTDCVLLGGTPSDQADGSSQLPLDSRIQLLVTPCPITPPGTTSPVARMRPALVPGGNPAGLTNWICASWLAVSPELLLPKLNWSAPPPLVEPFQL